MAEIDSLVRDNIKKMKEYVRPPILPVPVKLNQNESPYELPKEVIDVFSKRLTTIDFNVYNEGSSEKLREKLAKKFNVSAERVIVGCGIDELLYYIILVFTKFYFV